MKINKYNDFLLESLNILINEALVLYTQRFKETINELRSNKDESVSKVANFIYSVDSRDIDKLVYNYINVSKENDKVSFVPSNKIELNELIILKPTYIINCFNNSILELLGIKSLENIIHSLDDIDLFGDNHNINFRCKYYMDNELIPPYGNRNIGQTQLNNSWIKIDEFTNVPGFSATTFMLLQSVDNPKLRVIVYNPDSEMDDPTIASKHSIPTIKPSDVKIGRFINKLIELFFKTNKIIRIKDKEYTAEDFTTSDIEKFVNTYTSIVMYENNLSNQFEEVSGEDIKFWYSMSNYENNSGQLGNSCMRYMSCQNFFKIYTDNTEVCRLLILKNFNSKLIGRALIWTDINGKTYIDRIYTNKDSYINLFKMYAESKGYINVYGTGNIVEVQVNPGTYDAYPYMDSLKWYIPTNGILSNVRHSDSSYLLQETDGDYELYS